MLSLIGQNWITWHGVNLPIIASRVWGYYHLTQGQMIVPPNLVIGRVTPPRLLHIHIIVASQWLQCRAALYAHWFCFAAQNFNAIHCDVTMTLNIGITILPDLNWFWNYFINKGKLYKMRSFCFISVYKTYIDCSVIGWWWKLSLPRCCSYRPFYHPPPPPSPGVIEGAGMNSTLGVIISTTIRLSSQYLFTNDRSDFWNHFIKQMMHLRRSVVSKIIHPR